MNFVDKTLLSFSDAATAGAVFSERALKAVVSVSYGVPAGSLSGLPVPRFDSLEFAPFGGATTTEIARADYTISRAAETGPVASGLQSRIDILWRGAVAVSAAFPRAAIGVEANAVPDLSDIDGDIPAPLPADPAALDTARRAVVLNRLRANAHDPNAVTEAILDAWLAEAGVADISSFLQRAAAAVVPMSQFVLSFAPLPGTAVPAPLSFPVATALLVRDVGVADFRLADLLQAARAARSRLEIEGIAPKSGDPALPKGRPAVLWLVEDTWFDDPDWPGGQAGNAAARRADRIDRATTWLATQGVALAPVPG